MESNQQALVSFFEELNEEFDILDIFFEMLYNTETFAQKEASLLAIKKIWKYSTSGEYLAQTLIERDYYLLWNKIEFSEKTVFVEAKDLNAAYQLGFMICTYVPSELRGGFIHNKDLYNNIYSYHPFYSMIEETKAQDLGIEKSPDGYYYQAVCLLAFQLDNPG